jgi:orotate phosphoribosyltransferase
MDYLKERIAEQLLRIGAVFLRPSEPFVWASGIKSPIYCDNRLVLSFPAVRKDVEKGLSELVLKHYPECEALFGTSTAGIAHAALTADILDLPMGYVRSSSKEHGRTNRIEGKYQEGQNVVIVEDLISTAGSCIQTAQELSDVGCNVLGVVSIFNYNLQKGKARLQEAGLKNYSLSDLDALVEVAAKKHYIKEKDIVRIIAFRDNPEDISWQNL